MYIKGDYNPRLQRTAIFAAIRKSVCVARRR